jgi:hypothetical protein
MSALNLLVGLTLLVALLALVLLGERKSARAPTWLLLRSLFPSWRFFEHIAPVPTLSYRVSREGADFGPWRDALPPIARTPTSLVLNARGNLHLAQQSLVERLSDDLDGDGDGDGDASPPNIVESSSYRLVQRLVLTKLRSDPSERIQTPGEARTRYQFRLTLPGAEHEEELFVSLVHRD